MAAAPYKMEAGSGHNCFPARSLFRTGHGGAGRWLVSLKPAQEERFREFICSASAEEKKRSETYNAPHRSRSCPSDRTSHRPEYVLDTAFLIKTHHVRNPSDLCAVDVSDKNLTEARSEEFRHFNSVAYINATENTLALESFRTFPILRELELSMNNMRRIRIMPGDFPHLQVLDLSFNCLSPDDLTQLGFLPRLRVLYLTGNELTRLPPDLTAPPLNDSDWTMFPSLEILMLDDNKLSQPAVFVSLAGLKSLRLLNLDSNGISAVPYLHQSDAGSSHTAVRGSNTVLGETRSEAEGQSEGAEEKLDYLVLSSTKDPDRTEVVFPSISSALSGDPRPKPPETTEDSSNLPSFLMSSAEELIQSFTPPLPNLTTLSLATNKIAREEDLLAAALFPSLEELVIYGNPLTTQRKGEPRLLKNLLQERLGVKITRKKMTEKMKPQLIIPLREKRKVNTFVPKIPKQPLMIEPPYPFLRLPALDSDILDHVMSPSPLPPIRTSSEEFRDTLLSRESFRTRQASEEFPDALLGQNQESFRARDASEEFRDSLLRQSRESFRTRQASEEEGMSSWADPSVESFFMTQVEDLLDPLQCHSPLPTPEEQDVSDDKLENKEGIPENFRGYEELYNVEADPDFIEPVGIQNNVRALQHALKHLLLYQDYRPSQNRGVQKRGTLQQSQTEKDLRPITWRSKKEVLADALASMKERNQLVELPLESMLHKSRASMDQQEVRRLLEELHHKYKFFHSEAVKRAAQLEADLRDTAKELLEAQGKMENVCKGKYGNRKGC